MRLREACHRSFDNVQREPRAVHHYQSYFVVRKPCDKYEAMFALANLPRAENLGPDQSLIDVEREFALKNNGWWFG
jgi:hypothetical protein